MILWNVLCSNNSLKRRKGIMGKTFLVVFRIKEENRKKSQCVCVGKKVGKESLNTSEINQSYLPTLRFVAVK